MESTTTTTTTTSSFTPAILALPAFLCQYFSACGTYYTPQFADTMHNISAERGDDVAFVCHIEHVGRNKVAFLKLDPPTLLTWQHKIFATKPHKYRLENPHDGDHNKWALHINTLQESDAGIYMCQVGTSPMISQTSYLFLKVPPKINADKTTHDMVVMENHNATLLCAADGSPTPLISWKRNDDKVIVTNDPEGFGEGIIYKPNLTIYKISRSHMADYICLADNGVMPADAWFVKVHVHFAPTVYPLEQRVVGYVNHDVKLQCKAEAWPRQEFKWFFQGRLILANNTKYQMLLDTDMPYLFESLSVLIIRMLTKDDFGAYYCVAKNEYGENKATVELLRKDNNIIERTFEKESNIVNKIASNDKYVDDDASGAGSGDSRDISETLIDDDDYYANITNQFKESKSADKDDENIRNEIKIRQQPPPYDHQSDDRSSRKDGINHGTSNQRFTWQSLSMSFTLFIVSYTKNIAC